MAKRRRRRRRTPDAPGAGGALTERSAENPPEIELAHPSPPKDAGPATPRRKQDDLEADGARRAQARFAALDLGTNNCRLLIASPRSQGFRVFDAFSRIVRLGEGMAATGAISDAAMARTIDALKVCAEKIARRSVTRQRCIATQACRAASNGREFLENVREQTGLEFEIIPPAEEARLAVAGCANLLDEGAGAGLIFDIGGGSTELSWVRPARDGAGPEIAAWTSMPIGVVSLSEKFGGRELSRDAYEELVDSVRREIAVFGDPAGLREVFKSGAAHHLGTSGTVTSIAGVHLGLPRYRRDTVDGLWLSADEVRDVTERLRAMSFEERSDEPCIGVERADLVVCGCAILDALLLEWPSTRIRVADRGLREGILVGLADAHHRERGKKRRRRKRRRGAQ